MTTPQDRTSRKIVALCRIRGLGENFAAVLTREVFYRSFGNRRQIASYVGITPMPYQSRSMDRDRRISRAGNPRAIQLAWLWLRYQPGSELAEWFRKRVGTLAGRTRRIAIVALGTQAAHRALALRRNRGSSRRCRNPDREHSDCIEIADGTSPTAVRGTRPFSSLEAQHLRVSGGRVSPGLRLMHEAFWCGLFDRPDRM